MKDRDTLLRRAEKLLAVRKEALRLTLESDRECMVKVVAALEAELAAHLPAFASARIRIVPVQSLADGTLNSQRS